MVTEKEETKSLKERVRSLEDSLKKVVQEKVSVNVFHFNNKRNLSLV